MPTDPVSDFVASTIRRIRIEKGIRVADMAWRTGIPLGSYSCLETGRYRMSLENLFRILHILGTDINQVWPGEITEWVEQVDEGFIERWVEKARSNQPPQVAMDDILQAICDTYGLTTEQLSSPSRRRDWAEARMAAAVLVKETPHLSLVGLSYRLRRDVSSISHSLRRAHERLGYDRQLRIRIRSCRSRLNARLRALRRD